MDTRVNRALLAAGVAVAALSLAACSKPAEKAAEAPAAMRGSADVAAAAAKSAAAAAADAAADTSRSGDAATPAAAASTPPRT